MNFTGPCPTCCRTCELPVLYGHSRAASKSKCGFVNPDAPNSRFLQTTFKYTYNRSCSSTTDDGTSSQYSLTGSYTINTTMAPVDGTTGACAPETSNFSGSATETSDVSGSQEGGGTFDDSCSVTYTMSTAGIWTATGTVTNSSSGGSNSTSISGNHSPGTICHSCLVVSNDTSSTSYSNEYTTSQLKAITVGSLPAWPSQFFEGAAQASTELSSDENTYSIEQSQYYFAIPIPRRGLSYELTWVERFTPDGGGDPVDTPHSYTYDGTSRPSNYNPNDPTTWPTSPTYELDQPDSNGITRIAEIKVICGDGKTITSS